MLCLFSKNNKEGTLISPKKLFKNCSKLEIYYDYENRIEINKNEDSQFYIRLLEKNYLNNVSIRYNLDCGRWISLTNCENIMKVFCELLKFNTLSSEATNIKLSIKVRKQSNNLGNDYIIIDSIKISAQDLRKLMKILLPYQDIFNQKNGKHIYMSIKGTYKKNNLCVNYISPESFFEKNALLFE